jgi:hypothetical protein
LNPAQMIKSCLMGYRILFHFSHLPIAAIAAV